MADHNNGVQRHQAEVLEQLIENQRLDIEVRRAEVETKSKEIEANERIGLRFIEAQEKSRYLRA